MREGGRGLVVIPTYNEAANLTNLVPQVLGQDPRLDILIVDDNSPDGTGQLAEALRQKEPRLSVIHREGKLGLGTAYIAGFRWALERDYAFVFEMDADFSHDPAHLKDFLRAIAGADLVLGSRYATRWLRRAGGMWTASRATSACSIRRSRRQERG